MQSSHQWWRALAHFLSMHAPSVFLWRELCIYSHTHAKVTGNHILLTARGAKNPLEECNFSASNLFVSHMKWQQFWLRWDKYMHEVDWRRSEARHQPRRRSRGQQVPSAGTCTRRRLYISPSAGKKEHARGKAIPHACLQRKINGFELSWQKRSSHKLKRKFYLKLLLSGCFRLYLKYH